MRLPLYACILGSLIGCSSEPTVAHSSLRVVLHDAPADVDEVWVEFAGVSASSTEHGWVTVSEDTRSVELLSLQNGVFEELGLAELPAGHYDQVRLDVTRAWVVEDGVSYPLDVPSGSESGLKIGHGFEVLECGTTTLSLDWDVGSHLQHNAQGYKLRPVVVVDSTTIEGCGPTLVELTQTVHNAWQVGIWDYYGDVAAHYWQYQGYVPFDPTLGTLHSVRVDQTLDVAFDLTSSVPGETFWFRMVFAGGGLWTGDSFPITTASVHNTYTYTQDPATNDWSQIAWGYYFETYAKTTPHTINNTAQLTYIYEPN